MCIKQKTLVNGKWYKHYELQKIDRVHKKLFDSNTPVDKEAIRKDKKIVRNLRAEGIDNSVILPKRVREVKFDKSLVGRLIDRGQGETGKITRYDEEGPYHFYVTYDK